jgi:predicted thioesterase
MKKGKKYTSRVVVSNALTAKEMGSGDMPVYATPAMVALVENAAMMCVADDIEEDCSTVGIAMNVSHVKASPVGAEISATAELTDIEERKLTFKVSAYDGETLIGEGVHIRFIVKREKFLSKL